VTEVPPPIPVFLPTPAEVQQQLTAARQAAKKIRRAAAVATTDAWTIAIFAALSLVCGLSGDISGVLLGLAMGVVAYVEFTSASRLRRLDPSAIRRLGYNQFALAGVLIVYALWSLYAAASGGGLLAGLNVSEVGLGVNSQQVADLGPLLNDAMYGTLIVVAIFGQGSTAWYYFSRGKHLRRYVAETPPWIIEMQRAGEGV
jgi:hypothetical protein